MPLSAILDSLRYIKQHRIYVTRRTTATFVVLALCGAIVIAVALLNVRDLTTAGRMVAHTQQVIGEIRGLNTKLVEAETAQTRFLLTGDEDYLATYNAEIEKVYAGIDTVAALTVDNERQQYHVEEVRGAINERIATMNRNIELRRAEGINAARQSVLTGLAKQQMDAVREIIGIMENEERTLLRPRVANSQAKSWQTFYLLLAPFPAALLFLALLWAMINKDMGQQRERLLKIQQTGERLMEHKGDLEDLSKKIADGEIEREELINRIAQAASHVITIAQSQT